MLPVGSGIGRQNARPERPTGTLAGDRFSRVLVTGPGANHGQRRTAAKHVAAVRGVLRDRLD